MCRANQLDENGNSKVPEPEEKLTAEEAWIQARRTGSDMFSERIPKIWECLDTDLVGMRNEEKLKEDSMSLRKNNNNVSASTTT